MEEIVIDTEENENENVVNVDLSINVLEENNNNTIITDVEEFTSSSPVNGLTFRNSPSSIKNKYISPKNNKKLIEKLKKHVESEKIECICCYEIGFPSVICKKTCVANPKHLVCNRCFIKQRARKCFFCSPLDDGHKTSSRREQRRRPAYDIARGLALQNINNFQELLTDLSNNNLVIINSSPEYRRYRTRNNRAVYPIHYGTQIVVDDREQTTYQPQQDRLQVLLISMARCCLFLSCAWFLSLVLKYDNTSQNPQYNNTM